MSETAAGDTGTYLYGVTFAEELGNENPSLESTGVGGGGQIRTIEHGDLAAIVSDAPLVTYDVTPDNLQAHERVLEEILQSMDLLPVSFGIVATDDEAVKDLLLESQAEELRQSLEYVRGKVELTLQVLWNQEQVFREIVQENPEIQQLRDSIAGQPADAVREQSIRLGEMTAAALEKKSQQESQRILDALEPLVDETKLNNNLTDMMLLNAAFLVNRDKISAMDDKVGELSQGDAGRMIYQYVGPLPPFDFVSIRIQSEGQ